MLNPTHQISYPYFLIFSQSLYICSNYKTKKIELWLTKFQKNVLLVALALMNVLLKQFLREISTKLMLIFAPIAVLVQQFVRLTQFLLLNN